MHTTKVQFLILFSLIITFMLIGGITHASSQLAAPDVATAATIYVDADATGAHDGTSWANAYNSVQDALAAAASGDEIWVAEGVYYPDEGSGQTDNDCASTFTLTHGVALYGGFDPSSGIDEFAERNWGTYITVLSGDIDKNDTTDPNGVVADSDDIEGNNASHVVSASGVSNTTALDGFVITAGDAAYGNNPTPNGGGMYNDQSSPTLTNVTFSGNLARGDGGGMYNDQSSPSLTHVTFSGNSAYYDGSGMYNNQSNPTLTHVTFSTNSSENGSCGGMCNDQSSPTLIDVTFDSNSVYSSGGGMCNRNQSNPTLTNVIFSNNHSRHSSGGGMRNTDNSNPTLTNVTFFGNVADTDGGGMDNDQSSPSLTNVTFNDNTGHDGGGMYNNQSSPSLTQVNFNGNYAGQWGGGMSNDQSSPSLTHVTFNDNQASDGGGGMSNIYSSNPTLMDVTFNGNYSFGPGGGMDNFQSSPALTNTTFHYNRAEGGGGGMHNLDHSNPTLINVTFSDNLIALGSSGGGGMYNGNYSNSTLTNVSFSGNSADYGGGMYNYQSDPTLTNVTFSGNLADIDGGGMYNQYGSPTLINAILWGNSVQIYNDNSTPSISYSDIQGSGGSGSWDTLLGTDGGGNIDANPLFVRAPDPDNDDYGDLHLRSGSPAIDSGTNTHCPATDLDGNPRPGNGTCDMGAYEFSEHAIYLPLVLK